MRPTVPTPRIVKESDVRSLIRTVQRLEQRVKILEEHLASIRTDKSPYTCVHLHE